MQLRPFSNHPRRSCLFIGTDCDDGDDQTVDDEIGSDCLCAGTLAVAPMSRHALATKQPQWMMEAACLQMRWMFVEAIVLTQMPMASAMMGRVRVCGPPRYVVAWGHFRMWVDIPNGDYVMAIKWTPLGFGGDCTLDEDADGICDDVDECVGEVDACGGAMAWRHSWCGCLTSQTVIAIALAIR